MLKKKKILLLLLFAASLIAVSIIEISAQSADKASAVTIRKIDKQVVLYTVVRGNYGKAGMEIGMLYARAATKQITPQGAAYFVYLNNPTKTSCEHYLTEIRIPVEANALKYAGSLGDMTDVKEVPAVEVAVALKPEGMADPSCVYRDLEHWIAGNGYTADDSPIEKFLTNAQAGKYEQMKSEIMIPIVKVSLEKK
ncbi:MAG: GyrI-like domain-containing protein [Sedimentisphaerales bacterium]